MAEETPAFAQATSAKESAPETPIAPIITPVELLIGIPPATGAIYGPEGIFHCFISDVGN